MCVCFSDVTGTNKFLEFEIHTKREMEKVINCYDHTEPTPIQYSEGIELIPKPIPQPSKHSDIKFFIGHNTVVKVPLLSCNHIFDLIKDFLKEFPNLDNTLTPPLLSQNHPHETVLSIQKGNIHPHVQHCDPDELNAMDETYSAQVCFGKQAPYYVTGCVNTKD